MKKILKSLSVAAMYAVMGITGAQSALAYIDTNAAPVTLQEIEYYINLAMEVLYGIGGTVVVIFLVWGAIKWATSGGDETKVDSAKGTIMSAIWGALVLFGVFVILATVRAIVTRQFFN